MARFAVAPVTDAIVPTRPGATVLLAESRADFAATKSLRS
jgi:hypothetical protein